MEGAVVEPMTRRGGGSIVNISSELPVDGGFINCRRIPFDA